jgi:integrase
LSYTIHAQCWGWRWGTWMAKALNRLSARTVQTLTTPGRHADGGNLYLTVSPSGAKSWLFIYRQGSRQREMGLGGINRVPLARAREMAALARQALAAGKDPIALKAGQTSKLTFGAVADEHIAAMESAWRNEKHRAQWRMTLTVYAKSLRALPIDSIDTEAILSILKPLWLSKPETASRLRGRIEAVLDAAKARGLREGDNPARWKGHLDNLLPRPAKLTRGHHVAMPYRDLPGFVARLREYHAVAALALEFTILTAARSGEVLGTTWDEIDGATKIWTVPATRMKAGRIHRVPLSDQAMDVLDKASALGREGFVFPGTKAGKPLSNMAMDMTLRRMQADVTVHGFRSSFRDWVGEETSFPREVAEAALAHIVGDETERAYRRGDALQKRRALMVDWADYCATISNLEGD